MTGGRCGATCGSTGGWRGCPSGCRVRRIEREIVVTPGGRMGSYGHSFMKTLMCLFTIGAVAALPAGLEAKIVRTVEKTFSVQPGGNFRALTQGGDIKVSTADIGEVRITARQVFRTDSEKKADEMLSEMTFKLEQQGNDIVAEARYEKRAINWLGHWPPASVDLTVTLPRNFNLDIKTSGGDIAVGSLRGTVKARTSGGDLKFARIDGDIDAHTSGGDIRLEEGTATARLHTSGGDIGVNRAGGQTTVSTSGGDIHLDSVAELVRATTSGGDIVARITRPIKADTELSTSGGRVKVFVPKDSGFALDARTSGGDVDAEGLTMTIERGGVGKSRLAGSVNGGGPRLTLRSSGGDIVIRAE
ncbi:MAG: hypothetical protein C0502_01280 [Opitutus sp.]|nr:hypothetical protein [Opitutus sp.]